MSKLHYTEVNVNYIALKHHQHIEYLAWMRRKPIIKIIINTH